MAQPDFSIGTEFDGYRILGVLGQGGMGTTYRAEDLALGRLVALQFISPILAENQASLRRFRRVAQELATIDHSTLALIHSLRKTDASLYIVMEYVDGSTLRQVCDARGALSEAEAVRITAALADALADVHERGIVHGDVHPSNVLVTTEGGVKLTGFGLATLTESLTPKETRTTATTAGYMSPEQAQGEEIDERTDLWALGVMLYEMLTGQRPFRGDDPPAILSSIVNETPEPIRQAHPTVSAELEHIVARALAKDPADRYQNAREMLTAFASYTDRGAPAARAEDGPSPTLSGLRTLLLGDERRPLPDVLADLAPVLPETVFDAALNAVSSIGFMGRTARYEALVQLLLHAPEAVRQPWLERTLPYLPLLVHRLPDTLLDPVLVAMENTADVYDQEDRARALATLVRRLPEPEGDELLAAEALRVIEERRWDWERVLAALAAGLRGTAAQDAAAPLLAAARQMESPPNRARVLVHLLPFLADTEHDQALAEALAAARAAQEPALLAALRPHVPVLEWEALLQEAVTLARQHDAPLDRAEALAVLASQVEPYERLALRDEIQALHMSKLDPWVVARWFDAAPQGGSPGLPAYLSSVQQAQVLDAIADEPWPTQQAFFLVEMIPHLAPALLPRMLDMLAAIDEPAPRAQVLRALAPVLPDELLPNVLAAALELDDTRWRLWVLDALVFHHPELTNDPVVAEHAPLFRDRVGALLDRLDEEQQHTVLLELIDAIWDHFGGSAPPGEQEQTALPPEGVEAAASGKPPELADIGAEPAAGRGVPAEPKPPSPQPKPKASRPGWFDWVLHSGSSTASAPPRQEVVNTGFADPRQPSDPVSPYLPLTRGRSYYFWLEVGAPVVGAIDVAPTDIPREHLPADARLTVALFGFEGEIELTPGADIGEIQLQPDRSVRVTRPVARPDRLDHAELLERRLFFPVRLPQRSGTARLRCNLYYERVLVQSHLVQVTMAPWPTRTVARYALTAVGSAAQRLSWMNRVASLLRPQLQTRVDYTLSNTLRPDRLARLKPHRLSLLLNDNGDGTHGFRFFGRDEQTEFKQDAALTGQELQNLIDQARGAMRQAAWGDALPWSDQPYRYEGPADDERLRGDLLRLARWGYRFYDALIDRLAAGTATDRLAIRTAVKELKRLMRTPGYIQVASKDSAQHVVPVALFYDQALDTTLPSDRYRLCPAFLDALHAETPLLTSACFEGHCPTTHDDDVVCPSGFWGFRHNIGLPVTIGGSLRDLATEIAVEAAPQLTMAVSTDHDFVLRAAHEQALQRLRDDLGWHYADTRDDALDLMQTTPSHLLYFYCHGGLQNDMPYLQVGSLDEHGYITRDLLRSRDIFWATPQPLVFLNGCHTTAVEPEQALNLVTGFVETANAAGVLGTEITVFEPLACAFAEECLRHFMNEVPIGEAVRRARLKLLQDGNPLGLVYIPFVIASLTMVRTESA